MYLIYIFRFTPGLLFAGDIVRLLSSSTGNGGDTHQSQPLLTADLVFAQTQYPLTRIWLLLLSSHPPDQMEYIHPVANHICACPLVFHPRFSRITTLTVSLLLLLALSRAYISSQTAGLLHPITTSVEEYALAPCQGRVPWDTNWCGTLDWSEKLTG